MDVGVVRNLILLLHILASVGLIVMVVLQTQREQGIMGLFGQGSAPSKTRGRGTEETLKAWTKRLAITFYLASLGLLFFQSYV